MAQNPSASRTLAVLELLAASSEPMAAGHLSRELGIPRASLYRLLNTMAEHGFVMPDPETNRWALGVAAYELAWGYRRHNPLQRVAKPLLARLVDSCGHSGHVTVLQGSDVVYVIEERAPHSPSLVTDVGVRLPAHLTASGLAMLAALSPAQLAALYPSGSLLVQRGGLGPATVAELRQVVRETRDRGHAVEEDSVTPGFSSVALPVLDRASHPIAAVAVTFPTEALDQAGRLQLVGAVRRMVQSLNARLGGGRV